MATPEIYELFRLEEIAYDVAFNTGETGTQGINRALRLINRAAIIIAGHDKRWSWLHAKDYFTAVADQEEYSLNQDVKELTGVWLQGSSRQKLDRIPTTQFNEIEPESDIISGTPRIYDIKGVDSSGCKVISLYPVPDSGVEVWYRYYKQLLPIRNQQSDVCSSWGMPVNIVPILIEVATALSFQGLNDTRFNDQLSLAISSIENAYAADQGRPDTRYRARDQIGIDMYSDGRLPSNFED